jgi:thioredoxin reductase (NADPH)
VAREAGGVITESALVENWPGVKSTSGIELMEKVHEQVASLGAQFIFEEVTSITGEFGSFVVSTVAGRVVKARTVIIAIGTVRRKLAVPGEKELTGRGVSYCATCDAFFFRGKTVAVIGGAESAVGTGELLANFAVKVYLIYRRDRLRAEPLRTDRLLANPKVEVMYNTAVEAIEGKETVTGVVLDGGKKLAVDGVFIEIGFDPPRTLSNLLNLEIDELGFIQIDRGARTNVRGVYAAGDVTTGCNKLRQLVTAAAEGALAAASIFEDLEEQQLEL